MTCQIAAFLITLSDCEEGHSPSASFAKCDFFRTVVQQLTRFQLT